MRPRDEWSQDVVLRAMTKSIAQGRQEGCTPDFILVTGDLAFSGKPAEYELVKRFLTTICESSGVPRESVFCVPGNHDVDRDKQTLCFRGARQQLTSPNAVDPILTPGDNLETLLQRQQAYRDFQASYFSDQARTTAVDGLGYVASLSVDDVTVAIVGLNSAWLAEGGDSDHGQLLIGERQILGALDIVERARPHVVIAMAHHPLHLLRDFDRLAALNRINAACDFFHCGHLHQPEARGAGFDARACLTVAAGASFETREARNTYSIVRLNLEEGTRTLTTVGYDIGQSAFVSSGIEQFPFELAASASCDLGDLAQALDAFSSTCSPYAYYLAALLLGQKTEVPVSSPSGHVFAAISVLEAQPEDGFRRKTIEFLRFRNVLRVFAGRLALAALLERRGYAVQVFSEELKTRCAADASLANRVAGQNNDVRCLLASQPRITFGFDLLQDLADAQDWYLLHEQATRQLASRNPAVVVHARRMIALAQAHGPNDSAKQDAVLQYRALITEGVSDVSDRAHLANLLRGLGRLDEAKRLVIESVVVSPIGAVGAFVDLGHAIVSDTGDRAFRYELEAALAKRGDA